MPSFDIVSKTDMQLVDNAVNTAKKELINRYDLKDELCAIEIDKKTKLLKILWIMKNQIQKISEKT